MPGDISIEGDVTFKGVTFDSDSPRYHVTGSSTYDGCFFSAATPAKDPEPVPRRELPKFKAEV